ncbi:hypothetical protein HYQ59_0829 [Lactobacillus crispatus]|nr:hypothetical protein [Lactobacillus crispatus]
MNKLNFELLHILMLLVDLLASVKLATIYT